MSFPVDSHYIWGASTPLHGLQGPSSRGPICLLGLISYPLPSRQYSSSYALYFPILSCQVLFSNWDLPLSCSLFISCRHLKLTNWLVDWSWRWGGKCPCLTCFITNIYKVPGTGPHTDLYNSHNWERTSPTDDSWIYPEPVPFTSYPDSLRRPAPDFLKQALIFVPSLSHTAPWPNHPGP